jgi:hypothetical protein
MYVSKGEINVCFKGDFNCNFIQRGRLLYVSKAR